MRLTDLFEQVILEAPEEETNERRTVTFSAADVYLMSMLPIPKSLNKQTGKMVADPKDFEQRTYVVGTEPGMVDPKFAAGISQWKADGSIPGRIRDMDTGELVPYDKNSYLADVGRTLVAATLELGANLTRFGATGLDYIARGDQKATDFILSKFGYPDIIDSDGPMQFPYTKAATGTSENPMWLDAWSKKWEESTDLKYQDEKDITANAVQRFSDIGGLFLGTSGATWGGAFALLAGELPSEVVDVALLSTTAWWTGGALNVAFNASEAGGAAAIEIQRQIEDAYEKGTLQKTVNWTTNVQAAKDMIAAEGTVYETDQEYNNAVEKLAMDQTVYAAYHNGLLKVAVTAGVLDSVADRLMIRPPVPSKYVKNAALKKVIEAKDKTKNFAKGTVTEMGQEGLEQILINLAVIHATGDESVVSTYEGVVNAMYNSVYGTAASGLVQGGVSTINLGSKGTKATYAQLRRFFAGEGTVEELFTNATEDPAALKAALLNNDPNSEKFGQIDFLGALKKRDPNFVTVDDLSKKDRQKFLDGTHTRKDRRDGYKIKGKRYDIALLESNTKDAELMAMFQNSVNKQAEGKIQSTFENEEQIEYVAKRLGVYAKGDDINKMMAKLEDLTKLDIRIAGASTLEAPLWSELTPLQKRQFVTEGVITFNNHPERGNQRWTREKVLYTSRINGETLPPEVQNLADNVEARPTANQNQGQLKMENDIVRNAENNAFQDFQEEQELWDEEFGQTHNPDGSPKDPNAEGIAGRQLTGEDTTDELQGRRPDKNMEHYQEIAKNKLLNNIDYQNAKKRLTDQKEQFAKELKAEQDAWDRKYSTTHHHTGVAKIDSKFIDGRIETPPGIGPTDTSDGETDGETDSEFDTEIKPSDLETNNQDVVIPSLSNSKKIAEDQIIYRMQMNVADGGYANEQELRRTLQILEQDYPGITNKVLTTDVGSYFKNKKQIDKEVAEKIENSPKPVFTPSSRPPEGVEVELDGTTYRWLGKEGGKGGMWAVVKPDGTRGTTNHQNHSKLIDKWNNTKNAPSKENVSEIGFGEVDNTPPANTQDSIKTAQDQVTPNLSPSGPNASGAVVKKEVLPPNTQDSIKTAQDQVTPSLTPTTTIKPQDQEGGVGGTDGEVADVTSGDAEVTPNLGRGRPPTDAETAERVRLAKLAQQKADEIKRRAEREKAKADADALADIERQADQATKDAQAKRDAEKKAKQDAEREKTPNLSPDGPNMPPAVADIINDPENDQNLLPNQQKVTDPNANKPINFIPQNKLTKDQRDAIGGYGDYAQDTEVETEPTTDPKDTGTPDRGKNVKDQDPNTPGIQTEPATDKETDSEKDATTNQDQADQAQGLTDPNYTPNFGVVTPTKKTAKVTTGKDATTGTKQTTTKNINTKNNTNTSTVGKTARAAAFFGMNNDDEEVDPDLMKFYPAKYRDPLKLDKAKGAMGRATGLSGRK